MNRTILSLALSSAFLFQAYPTNADDNDITTQEINKMAEAVISRSLECRLKLAQLGNGRGMKSDECRSYMTAVSIHIGHLRVIRACMDGIVTISGNFDDIDMEQIGRADYATKQVIKTIQ
jgi:hypothetical protein